MLVFPPQSRRRTSESIPWQQLLPPTLLARGSASGGRWHRQGTRQRPRPARLSAKRVGTPRVRAQRLPRPVWVRLVTGAVPTNFASVTVSTFGAYAAALLNTSAPELVVKLSGTVVAQ